MDGTRTTSRTTKLHARRAASLVLAASALLFAAPAVATADPATDFAAGSAPVQAAQAIALEYWHTAPCGGDVSLVWMGLTASTNATSTWQNPVGQYDAPEQNTACQIAFNNDLAWDWTRFCSILVHEYGHLNGHAHATEQSDVMYPFYEGPVAECVAAAPAQPAAEPTLALPADPVLPALKAAASAAQPRAISSSHAVKRGVLVVVREPRRHAKRHAHRHTHHARPHHKRHNGKRAHRVGHLVRVA
ncbi:MAG: hypothetical protein JWM73_984 [Solirubrobacterales bacterium]|nr:hypothetical protein [Solirubrobacterales bacterium]